LSIAIRVSSESGAFIDTTEQRQSPFQMTNDKLRRLPAPPLFIVRPPPKPPGPFFDQFVPVELFNGQCVRPSTRLANASSTILLESDEPINWFNLFLRLLAMISVVSCLIIAILIFVCLK
jgi:hypothetical protein